MLESWEKLVGRGQPDFLRCRLCKTQAILVLGSSCLWPNHIPSLGATRLPAPFRTPFSDPDQPSVCTSSQGLLVWSDPTLPALDGPQHPSQGSWSGLFPGGHLEGDLGVGPKSTPNLEPDGVKPVCTSYVTLGITCHWAARFACQCVVLSSIYLSASLCVCSTIRSSV